MTPVIQIIRDEHIQGTRQARSDWGKVTGKPITLKPAVFLDTRTGWRYSQIVGAVAYPAIEPGCIIVMGVSGEPDPAFTVLEYVESTDIYRQIEQIIDIRGKYAYGQHEGILQQWIGDPDRYLTLIAKCSVALEKNKGHDRGLYIREPADWGERHAFPMYVRQIHTALGAKTLRLNGHTDLINRLQSFQPPDADKGKIQDFPAVGMLGALTHTLMIERPWEQDADHGEPIMMEI
jgi:hypothetical protein